MGKAERTNGIVHHILRGAGVLAALNLCYLLLMVIVFALPVGTRVRGNAAESLYVWKEGAETEAPLFHDNRIFWNDTSSEILLVNCAVTESGTPLQRGLALFYTQVPDTGDIPPVQSYRNLEAALSEHAASDATIETYGRYWYLEAGAVRLLLSFLTIGEIRWLLYACGALLALWVFLRVYTLLGARGVLPLAFAFASRTLVLQTATMMTATDVFTACAAMIALTYLYKKPWFAKNRVLFYLITGSVTFAIGPFIAPLLTLGMTLLLDLQLTEVSDRDGSAWAGLLSSSVAWAAGYALTLACKMVVSMLAAGSADAADVAAGYMGAGAEAGGGFARRFEILRDCLYRVCMPVQATAVLLLVFAGILFWAMRKNGVQKPQHIALTLAVALYPAVWALIVSEHSRHDYAVNMFAITVYGLAVLCAGLVKNTGERRETVPERKTL